MRFHTVRAASYRPRIHPPRTESFELDTNLCLQGYIPRLAEPVPLKMCFYLDYILFPSSEVRQSALLDRAPIHAQGQDTLWRSLCLCRWDALRSALPLSICSSLAQSHFNGVLLPSSPRHIVHQEDNELSPFPFRGSTGSKRPASFMDSRLFKLIATLRLWGRIHELLTAV